MLVLVWGKRNLQGRLRSSLLIGIVFGIFSIGGINAYASSEILFSFNSYTQELTVDYPELTNTNPSFEIENTVQTFYDDAVNNFDNLFTNIDNAIVSFTEFDFSIENNPILVIIWLPFVFLILFYNEPKKIEFFKFNKLFSYAVIFLLISSSVTIPLASSPFTVTEVFASNSTNNDASDPVDSGSNDPADLQPDVYQLIEPVTDVTASTEDLTSPEPIPGNGTSSVEDTTSLVNGTAVEPDGTTDLAATVISDTQVDLSWTIPFDGGSPITGYKIQHKVNDESITTLETSFGNDTTNTFSDTSLSPGDEIKYRIAAVNAIGQGFYSNSIHSVTTYLVPPDINGTDTGIINNEYYFIRIIHFF